MIELTTLRYFAGAFETGTFSQAARANEVSQPTVSAAIQKLEQRLGGALFLRAKSGLQPTPLAIRLYHDTVESVAHLSSLDQRLQTQPQQRVRIHCAPDVLLQSFAPGLNALRWKSPDLTFAFTDDPLGSDLAFLSEACVPAGHGFILLTEEPFCVALGRFHPLARAAGLRLEDIVDQALIHRPYCPDADRLDPAAAKNGASPGPAAQAMNDAQLLDLVAAGLGIALVPRSHGEGREDIILRPFIHPEKTSRRLGISYRKSVFASTLAKQLADTIPLP